MTMSLELFIGNKEPKPDSPPPAKQEQSQVKTGSSDPQEGTTSSEAEPTARSSSLSSFTVDDITIETLEQLTSREFINYLIQAVREHPLHYHYIMLLKRMIEEESLGKKTINELSVALQLSEGFLTGLILAMKNDNRESSK